MSIYGDICRINYKIIDRSPKLESITNVGIEDIGYCRVRFYNTPGTELLYLQYVKKGDDCSSERVIEQQVPDSTSGPVGTMGTWTSSTGSNGYYITENIADGYFELHYDTEFVLTNIHMESSAINNSAWIHIFEYYDVESSNWVLVYQSESVESPRTFDIDVSGEPLVNAVRWRTTTTKVYPWNLLIPVFRSTGYVDILSNSEWAVTANSGIAVPDITKHILQNLDLYLARWAVTYYSTDGVAVLHTEYVVNGEDAMWGANKEWSDSAEGEAVVGILENITANISVYRVVTNYLPSSNAENIICEAFADNFDASALAWGVGANPVQFSASGATKQADDSVLIPVRSSGTLAYVDLEANNTPFTAYIVCKLVNPSTYSRILSAMAARSAGQGMLLYGATVNVSSWANDTNTGVNASSAYFVGVMKFGGNTNSGGIVNNGNYISKPPSVAGRYLTIARTDIDPSTVNAEPCDILVKYLGVVKEAETEATIRANMQYLMNEFGIGGGA